MERLFRTLGKYWFPGLCILAGIGILIASGGANPQDAEVKLGAVSILLVGIISLLFILDVIKKPVRLALTIVLGLGAIWLLMKNSNSITDEIAYQKQVKTVQSNTIQGLKDIRSAEEAYLKVNKQYTQDLDELVQFVKAGQVPVLKKIGAIPDSIGTESNARKLGLVVPMPEGMTDEEIKAKGLIVRDTVYISVMEAKFENPIAKKGRKYPFDVNTMKFAPHSKKAWDIKAGIANLGGVEKPVLEVKDPEPFTGEALMIGSMEDAHLNGNWKED